MSKLSPIESKMNAANGMIPGCRQAQVVEAVVIDGKVVRLLEIIWGKGVRQERRQLARSARLGVSAQKNRTGEPMRSEKKSWQRATLPPPSEAVPSPRRVLTSVFGMGTGIALAPWSPGKKDCIEHTGRNESLTMMPLPVPPPCGFGTVGEQANDQASRLISSG